MSLRLSDLKRSNEDVAIEVRTLKERMSRMMEVRVQHLAPDAFYLVSVPEDMPDDDFDRIIALFHSSGLSGTVVKSEVRVIQIG
jgi:hypothetical protein